MLTGIDIGGTNTDIAVLGEEFIAHKIPHGVSLSQILKHHKVSGRVGVSTSQPLNMLVTGTGLRVLLITIPGPGLAPQGVAVGGCIDHRGELVEDLEMHQVHEAISSGNPEAIAVCGKFSVRNPVLEDAVAETARKYVSPDRVATSHPIGFLDFPARCAMVKANASILRTVLGITQEVRQVSPGFLYFKGDGGLAQPTVIHGNPGLLLNSSPAAVALGVRYLTGISEGLIIDIGGTTTDLVPLSGGSPLMKTLIIEGRDTLVPSVASTSLPYGGDSVIVGNSLIPKRQGNARAFSGDLPTLTDALNLAGHRIGDSARSSVPAGTSAMQVIDWYVDTLVAMIQTIDPEMLIGTGFLSPFLIPRIASRSGVPCIVPEHASSANALGVAVSRVSLSLAVHADSEKKRMTVNGQVYPYPGKAGPDLIEWAVDETRALATAAGASPADVRDVELVSFSTYDVVRGGVRHERITDLVVQIPPGITSEAP